jgi:hypothetical protein
MGWTELGGEGRRVAMSHLFPTQNTAGAYGDATTEKKIGYLGWYEKSAGVYSNGSGILSAPSGPWTISEKVRHQFYGQAFEGLPWALSSFRPSKISYNLRARVYEL